MRSLLEMVKCFVKCLFTLCSFGDLAVQIFFFSFGLMFLICKAYSSAYGCKKDIMLQRSNFKSLEKCTCDGKAVSRLSGELELLLMYGSNR